MQFVASALLLSLLRQYYYDVFLMHKPELVALVSCCAHGVLQLEKSFGHLARSCDHCYCLSETVLWTPPGLDADSAHSHWHD